MNFPAVPANAPRLELPGRGLPLIEGLIARYIIYPRAMRAYSGSAAIGMLSDETRRIEDLTATLDEERFFKPVLIPRLNGLEDSSRQWSPAMVLEHLVMTLRPMTRIAETLARGEEMNVTISTAAVKPKGGRTITQEQWLKTFAMAAGEAVTRLAPLADLPDVAHPHRKAPTVRHPFFGAMPARGWIWLIAQHQALHRRQIEAILSAANY